MPKVATKISSEVCNALTLLLKQTFFFSSDPLRVRKVKIMQKKGERGEGVQCFPLKLGENKKLLEV